MAETIYKNGPLKIVTKKDLSKQMKDLICALLYGKDISDLFKGPLICASFAIKDIEGISDLRADLKAAMAELKSEFAALSNEVGIDGFIRNVNEGIKLLQSVYSLGGLCPVPVSVPPIRNVAKQLANAFLGELNSLINEMISANPTICLTGGSGGSFNWASANGGWLKEINDKVGNFGSVTEAQWDSWLTSANKSIQRTKDLTQSIGGKNAAGTTAQNVSKATSRALSLKAAYNQMGAYPITTDGGVEYENMFKAALDPDVYNLLKADENIEPVVVAQTPVYDYCGNLVGYTTSVTQGDPAYLGADTAVDAQNPDDGGGGGGGGGGTVTDYTITEEGGNFKVSGLDGNNPTLTLTKGQVYSFTLNLTSLSFYIKTAGAADLYSDGLAHSSGVVGLDAQGKKTGVVSFAIATNAPDTLVYVGSIGNIPQGTIILESSGGGGGGGGGGVTLGAYLTSLNSATGNGIVVKDGNNAEFVSITAASNQLVVLGGDGRSGNPFIAFAPDAVFPGTGGVVFPKGPTSNRDATPTSGQFRFNTDTNRPEFYNGTIWVDVDNENLPMFDTIAVAGQSDIVATVPADTLTIAAGANINLTTDAAGKILTVSTSAQDNTASSVGTGISIIKDKVGADLRFKSLEAGPGITITDNSDTVIISSPKDQYELFGSTTTTDGGPTKILWEDDLILTANTTWFFTATLVARRTDTSTIIERNAFKIEGVIDNTNGSTAILGKIAVTTYQQELGAYSGNNWTVDCTTNGNELEVKVVGESLKTIKWTANIKYLLVS